MPDEAGNLTPDDLEAFTNGRLDAEDADTARKLRAALAAARNFCGGWHVAPERTETLTLDGPGTAVLSLPSRNIVSITSITDAGVAVPIDSVDVSKRLGLIEKQSCALWSRRYGSIVIALTHGFSGESAADFEHAVLSAAEQMSAKHRRSTDMKRARIDDVEYEWYQEAQRLLDHSLLAPYQLIQSP